MTEPPGGGGRAPRSSHRTREAVQLLDVLYLVAWGQVGTLGRYLLQEGFRAGGVTEASGPLFLDLPANVLGSALMGLTSPSDLLLPGPPYAALLPVVGLQLPGTPHDGTPAAAWQLGPHGGHPQPWQSRRMKPGLAFAALPPGCSLQNNAHLLLGLRVGLCGCLTTYASWVLQSIQLLVGAVPPVAAGKSWNSNWLAGVSCLALGALASQAGLALGQHAAACLGEAWAAAVPAPTSAPDHGSGRARRNTGGRCMGTVVPHVLAGALLAALTVPSVVMIAAIGAKATRFKSLTLWAALLLSPVGCLLRWRLTLLNARPATAAAAWFPWGTWVANNLACVIDFAMAVVMSRVSGLSAVASDVVKAVMLGVSGCLSTVSTWAVELQRLGGQDGPPTHATLYFFASLGPSIALGLLIYGVAAWTS